MSHIVSIKTNLRDQAALVAACARLKLPAPVTGKANFYGAQTASGVIVQLADWRYPLVINPETGAVQCDNFNGRWGSQAKLDQFKAAYALEKGKLEARRKGLTYREIHRPNGHTWLEITGGK